MTRLIIRDDISLVSDAPNRDDPEWRAYDQNGDVIGYVSLYTYSGIGKTIASIDVKPQHRNKGLGGDFVRKLTKFYGRVCSDPQGNTSDAAHKMWQRLGAEKVPTDKSTRGWFWSLRQSNVFNEAVHISFTNFVKMILEQQAIQPSQADAQKLALAIDATSGIQRRYVLYDPHIALRSVSSYLRRLSNKENKIPRIPALDIDISLLSKNAIVGMLSIRKVEDGLWKVSLASAHHGYGPLLYDTAMGDCYPDSLTGDESDCRSSAANKIWSYYRTKRNDVEKLRSANGLVGMPPVCKLPTMPNIAGLRSRHHQFVSAVQQVVPTVSDPENAVIICLMLASTQFFSNN